MNSGAIARAACMGVCAAMFIMRPCLVNAILLSICIFANYMGAMADSRRDDA